MKKKHVIILITAIILVLALAGTVAALLSAPSEIEYGPAENVCDSNYSSYSNVKGDPAMTIDGVLDEEQWANLKWFNHTFLANHSGSMPSYKVTAFPTEYGVYVASVVTDSNLVHDGTLNNSINSNWYLCFTATNVGETAVAGIQNKKTISIDIAENIMSAYTNIDRAVVVEGTVNSGATESATLEMFIPWSVLEIDTSLGIPEYVGILPKYNAVLTGSNSVTATATILLEENHTTDYYLFGSNGYLTADAENAVVGDMGYGFAKTASWDISQEGNGIVRSSVGTEYHRIFFKDCYGPDFIIEATIIPYAAIDNDWPKAGFCFVASSGEYHAVFLDFGGKNGLVDSVNGTKNFADYSLISLNNEGNIWNWNQNEVSGYEKTNKNATKQEGVKLTVIKCGSQFWYFADGKYLTTETYEFIDKDVTPGFYALGADVVYKDYSCTALDQTTLYQILNDNNLYYINTTLLSSGGTAVTSQKSVTKGGSYTISLTSKSGYTVSSVKINGVEHIEDAKEKAVNGVYTVTGVKENQEVEINYEKCDGITFSGYIQGGNGNISATMILCNTTNRALRYEISATAAKGFKVKIPAGTYTITVTADNHEMVNTTLVLDEDVEQNYTLKESVFADSVTVNKNPVNSITSVWDMTKENKGVVSTSYDMDGKCQPLYFVKTGSNFVASAKIDYTTIFTSGVEYQPDLMGGFCFSDGKNLGWLVARNSGIAYTDWVCLDNLVAQNMLTYPDKRTANLTVAKYGSKVYVYLDGVLVSTLNWSQVAPGISSDAELAVGLYVITDKTSDIAFTNYTLETEDNAVKAYIANNEPKDETISANKTFSSVLTVNGTKLTSSLANWNITKIANGIIEGSFDMGTRGAPLYFTQTGSTMMVQATIEYSTLFVEGVDYQPDLFGGFVFSDGTHSGWLTVNQKAIVYNWNRSTDLTEKNYLTKDDGNCVKLTVVLKNGYFYIYIDDALVARRAVGDIVSQTTAETEMAVGLWMWTDKVSDIRYSDMSIITDADIIDSYMDNVDKGDTVNENTVTISNMQMVYYNHEYYVAQGATTDGKYFYCVLTKNNNSDAIIAKVRTNDLTVEKVSENLNLEHANDICYNKDRNILVVTNMNSVVGTDDIRYSSLTIVDPDTLEINEVKNVAMDTENGSWNSISKISYNSSRESYAIWSNSKIYVCDTDFNVKYVIENAYQDSGYTGQGMDSDDDYIYVVQSGSTDNVLQVHSWETGYLYTISIPITIEGESMCNWDGKYYYVINHEGCAIIDIAFAEPE